MNCKNCGTALTANYIQADGTLKCPVCGSVYRRKTAPPRQTTGRTLYGGLCAACGRPFLCGALFCSFCGTPTRSIGTPPDAAAAVDRTNTEADGPSEEASDAAPKKEKSNPFLVILLLALILIFSLLGVWIYLSYS